jgi:cytoskeletal protein RodZ
MGAGGYRTSDDVRLGGHGQEVTMRRLLIGLLILGGVIAAIAVIKRRSGSGIDEWDSFAADDVYAQASRTTANAADAVKGAATTATSAAKDATTKTADAARDAAATATRAAKDAATKTTDAAKDAAAKAKDAAKDA